MDISISDKRLEARLLADLQEAFDRNGVTSGTAVTIKEVEEILSQSSMLNPRAIDIKEFMQHTAFDETGIIDIEEFAHLIATRRPAWAKRYFVAPEERFHESMRARREISYQDQRDWTDVSGTQLSDYIQSKEQEESSVSSKDFLTGNQHVHHFQSLEALAMKGKRRRIQDLCHLIAAACVFDIDDNAKLDAIITQLSAIKERALST
eukprot:TRINITY_DN33438_c0_g1_i1.p1 TRINITY_DN33438_c0_g1~~TRINITY_DN33438_c0_g1_i1.p1  ORF type:complete len:207 (+),score=46.51 TRINITY_DN33438_c0_g1_i1:85-705(+)